MVFKAPIYTFILFFLVLHTNRTAGQKTGPRRMWDLWELYNSHEQ